MTREEKQLLLVDLCGRLPYKCMFKASKGVTHWNKLTLSSSTIDKQKEDYYEEFKPYLRPMSSMTEEEWLEFSSIDDTTEEWIGKIPASKYYYEVANYKQIDWLNAHHFDYRGLIEKGLALEAPEGMYGKEAEK